MPLSQSGGTALGECHRNRTQETKDEQGGKNSCHSGWLSLSLCVSAYVCVYRGVCVCVSRLTMYVCLHV